MTSGKKLVEAAVRDLCFVWVIWTFCLVHQIHLIAKRALRKQGRFYSKVAKMSNCWRAPSRSSKIYKAWQRLPPELGPERAKKVAGKLPPKAIQGRFGAVYKTVAHFLFAGKRSLEFVFKDVFVRGAREEERERTMGDKIDDDPEERTIGLK